MTSPTCLPTSLVHQRPSVLKYMKKPLLWWINVQLIYYATLLYDGSHLVVITVVVWEVEYQTGYTWVLKGQVVTSPTRLPTSLVHRWLLVCSSGAQFHVVTSDGTVFCIVTVVVWEVQY